MNRRKTLKRSWSLRRLLAPRQNRRTKPKVASQRPSRRLDLKAIARGALRGGLFALKALTLTALLMGIGVGGYYGYQRISSSSYFLIKKIAIDNERHAPEKELVRLVASIKGQNTFTLDLAELRRAIRSHPWVKDATVSRELPETIRIKVTEHKAHALLLLGHLYLLDAEGQVFKRADLSETDGLPVITGVNRLKYLNNPAASRQQIVRAINALDRYYDKVRPRLSEVNVGEQGRLTLYLRQGGVAVRMGRDVSDGRLQRFDRVWAALGPDAQRARVLFLDNEIRADRVTVRMRSSK